MLSDSESRILNLGAFYHSLDYSLGGYCLGLVFIIYSLLWKSKWTFPTDIQYVQMNVHMCICMCIILNTHWVCSNILHCKIFRGRNICLCVTYEVWTWEQKMSTQCRNLKQCVHTVFSRRRILRGKTKTKSAPKTIFSGNGNGLKNFTFLSTQEQNNVHTVYVMCVCVCM